MNELRPEDVRSGWNVEAADAQQVVGRKSGLLLKVDAQLPCFFARPKCAHEGHLQFACLIAYLVAIPKGLPAVAGGVAELGPERNPVCGELPAVVQFENAPGVREFCSAIFL